MSERTASNNELRPIDKIVEEMLIDSLAVLGWRATQRERH
jgi:hypothetical protein